jgi:hypothetical protein
LLKEKCDFEIELELLNISEIQLLCVFREENNIYFREFFYYYYIKYKGLANCKPI